MFELLKEVNVMLDNNEHETNYDLFYLKMTMLQDKVKFAPYKLNFSEKKNHYYLTKCIRFYK